LSLKSGVKLFHCRDLQRYPPSPFIVPARRRLCPMGIGVGIGGRESAGQNRQEVVDADSVEPGKNIDQEFTF
jgi:hypothetical protein